MKRILPLLVCLLAILPLHGAVSLNALFSDHAVLQKSDNVPVWGKADPGESVTVTLDKASAKTTAGPDGKWKARLDLKATGQGPFDMVVQGANTLTIKDVLVGEVWLCGGQSNMDFPLSGFPVGKTEIPASANPLLREFRVKFTPSAVLLDDVKGKWVLAGPKTSGAFSAVGYFYGKNLQKELRVPVGLLTDCLGGTFIETWMSKEALDADPGVKACADKAQADRLAFDKYVADYKAWQAKFGREDRPAADPQAFAAPGVDTRDWKPVTLPGLLSAAGLPDAGAIWLRKTIPVPSDDIAPNKGIDLFLADIRDFADVYWNGKKIASSDLTDVTHRYGVRANLVQAGESVLAVRIFNPAKGAGILPAARFQGNHHMLKGEWLAKAETVLPPLQGEALGSFPVRPTGVPYDPQNVASYLFNGMINPVIPYGMRGVIWYQGEGNWNRGYQYRTEFPLLIKDWRAKWGRGDFPFYYCQVANLSAHATKPGNNEQAELREAQTMALALPNTGQAILIDIGEENNIHPANKIDVGDRLARIALAQTYGKKDVIYSGPVYSKMAVEGDKIRVTFTHTDGGLAARPMPAAYQPLSTDPKTVPVVRNSPDGEVEGFAICGDDRKWKWATAKIDGSTVLVWSAEVPKPVAVRYAWASNPFCNLYNGGGLPAGPFRTDDFPPLSLNRKY
ncbi:MAG: sialate O-acetylesterase [Opitutaceae bacterium]|jgi:sialate O-acetylesterase